uniref:Uncharacterized protein n=1 Tax=mine drainage metagenome TaxID=410659 RepID=E6QTQ9_9ZZZZ
MPQSQQEIAMLRREIEMLMRERESLLRVSGAAALFVEKLDSLKLPKANWNGAEMLAESLNALSEDSLQEALESARNSIQATNAVL